MASDQSSNGSDRLKLGVARTATEVHEVQRAECCIVGGGPAGAVLALLLARKGVRVTLLEMHKNFDRDFRGDTIHPSVMEILSEIGLAERLLQMRHTKLPRLTLETAKGPVTVADFSRLKTRYPYITLLPQVRFLEFITGEAKRYPHFRLLMGANVQELAPPPTGRHETDQDGASDGCPLVSPVPQTRGPRKRGRGIPNRTRSLLDSA